MFSTEFSVWLEVVLSQVSRYNVVVEHFEMADELSTDHLGVPKTTFLSNWQSTFHILWQDADGKRGAGHNSTFFRVAMFPLKIVDLQKGRYFHKILRLSTTLETLGFRFGVKIKSK